MRTQCGTLCRNDLTCHLDLLGDRGSDYIIYGAQISLYTKRHWLIHRPHRWRSSKRQGQQTRMKT